jgi:hypothetical protein
LLTRGFQSGNGISGGPFLPTFPHTNPWRRTPARRGTAIKLGISYREWTQMNANEDGF